MVLDCRLQGVALGGLSIKILSFASLTTNNGKESVLLRSRVQTPLKFQRNKTVSSPLTRYDSILWETSVTER